MRSAQRDADYAYRLAVDPPAAKELRLFGLAGWTIDRFIDRRTTLHELQYEATRLRERSVLSSLVLVGAANVVVFWSLADAAADGRLDLGRIVTFAQAAVGASLIAFGGLNWALDGAGRAGRGRRCGSKPAMGPAGALAAGHRRRPAGLPARGDPLPRRHLRLPGAPDAPVLDDFDLTIPAGSSLAIVGQNGAGKTTLAKLLCRLYDPQAGAIEVDGVDLRDLDLDGWRAAGHRGVPGLHPLRAAAARQRRARRRARRRRSLAALAEAGAADLADARHAAGQGLRGRHRPVRRPVAAGRAGPGAVRGASSAPASCCSTSRPPSSTCAARPRSSSASWPPPAHCTTILISHRFSTVRQADRICVLEHGRVVELGTHDELMAHGGRYRTMFDLQAERFAGEATRRGWTLDVLA